MTEDKFEKMLREALKDPRAKEILRLAAVKAVEQGGADIPPDLLQRLRRTLDEIPQ